MFAKSFGDDKQDASSPLSDLLSKYGFSSISMSLCVGVSK
jgi:hypothetical protein